ncbi:MAG: glucuronate isomerase [Clostridia bacterium]|nr:glucuronate isomerase [Clostridia bacterium]
MKFMDENFMLYSDTAKKLFFDFAKDMPIIDYHCHLIPQQVADNQTFKNITEIWLYGDHYKWRAMRSCGISEDKITGSASDRERFDQFAKAMPYLIGNPLYHWTHLELQRYFGITKTLCPENADYIWDAANEQIADKDFCVHNIFKKFNVKLVGTTDNPVDDLEPHKAFAKSDCETVMAPSYRPDSFLNISAPDFADWIKKLEKAADMEIDNYDDLLSALVKRMDYFHENGCRISDIALVYTPSLVADELSPEKIFAKRMKGKDLTVSEEDMYRAHTIVFLGKEFAKRGWAMQLHMNTIRNNNTIMYNNIGVDTGFDSINDAPLAYNLSRLLDAMNVEGLLPKTILYSLNPKDNYVLGTMLGNFQGEEAKSKLQLGSGWWFNDQRDGMEEQLKCLANLGVLSYFVGMLTDSRSFLSYPRHEYFRRIMCNIIGGWVEKGEYPDDMKYLEEIIKGISYNNAKEYFNII